MMIMNVCFFAGSPFITSPVTWINVKYWSDFCTNISTLVTWKMFKTDIIVYCLKPYSFLTKHKYIQHLSYTIST